MVPTNKLFFSSLICCIFFFTFSLQANSITSTTLSNTGAAGSNCATLSLTSTTNPSLTTPNLYFILYGDGHFGSGTGSPLTAPTNNIKDFPHTYSSLGNYTATAYAIAPYSGDPPSMLSLSFPVNNMTSLGTLNPAFDFSSSSDPSTLVSTSWLPVQNKWNFTILSIKNIYSTVPVSGSFTYLYNSNEQNLSASLNPYNNTPNWFSGVSNGTAPTGSGYSNQLIVNFSNLKQNEVRHFYIISSVLNDPNTHLHSKLKLNYSYKDQNSVIRTHDSYSFGNFAKKGHPHDPNEKTVDQEYLCKDNIAPHQLLYTINFHNDGTAPANNIHITDDFDAGLIANSIQIVNKSFSVPCNWVIDPPGSNSVRFDIQGIELPGLNQMAPYLQPSYNATIGFISFTINTLTNLQPGKIINQAEIVFDTEKPVSTTIASTYINPDETNEPCLGSEEDREDSPEYRPPGHDLDRSNSAKALSQNKETNRAINIAPNPAHDHLNIRFTSNHSWKMEIINIQGQVFNTQFGDNTTSNMFVNVSTWPNSVYFIRLQAGDELFTSKLLKI